jgi:hypothetical protein
MLKRIFRNFAKTAGTEPAQRPEPLPFTPKPVMRFEQAMPVLQFDRPRKTMISFVVIVYKMPEQAKKTIISLGTGYQRGVEAEDYEIIVVENKSDHLLGEKEALSCSPNVRYFLRDEKLPTPVFAINFGAEQARGTHIAVIIDGARMCSPGVVNYTIAAAALSRFAVIAVPGYHLGHEPQQVSTQKGYDEKVEAEMLAAIEWPKDGYRLFEISCFSASSAGGFFKPIGESNCVAVSRELFETLGGYDTNFTETGGGQVNLDFYKRAVELPETQLFILLGEGCFHQLHGGVTTGLEGKARQETMRAHFAQYASLRGEAYCPPEKRAIYLGAMPDSALRFVRHGADVVITSNNL